MIYSKKHSHIKKQVIAEKCNHLLRTNKYVLFFHYNGAGGCNWQQVKQGLRLPVACKSLLVPSNVYGHKRTGEQQAHFPENSLGKSGFPFYSLFQGGALLVACSSPGQMTVILETCSSPTFLCLGGAYDMSPLSHLDIKRWAALLALNSNGTQANVALLAQLMQWQRVLVSLPLRLTNLPFLSTGLVIERLLAQLRLLGAASLAPPMFEGTAKPSIPG